METIYINLPTEKPKLDLLEEIKTIAKGTYTNTIDMPSIISALRKLESKIREQDEEIQKLREGK